MPPLVFAQSAALFVRLSDLPKSQTGTRLLDAASRIIRGEFGGVLLDYAPRYEEQRSTGDGRLVVNRATLPVAVELAEAGACPYLRLQATQLAVLAGEQPIQSLRETVAARAVDADAGRIDTVIATCAPLLRAQVVQAETAAGTQHASGLLDNWAGECREAVVAGQAAELLVVDRRGAELEDSWQRRIARLLGEVTPRGRGSQSKAGKQLEAQLHALVLMTWWQQTAAQRKKSPTPAWQTVSRAVLQTLHLRLGAVTLAQSDPRTAPLRELQQILRERTQQVVTADERWNMAGAGHQVSGGKWGGR